MTVRHDRDSRNLQGSCDDPHFDAGESAVIDRQHDDLTDPGIRRTFPVSFVRDKSADADNVQGIEQVTWPDLAAVLADFELTEQPDKSLRPGFVPTDLSCHPDCLLDHGRFSHAPTHGYRNGAHARSVELAVFDFEGKDEVRIEGALRTKVKRGVPTAARDAILAAFVRDGLAYVAHTSSTTPPDPAAEHRFRVIVPINRAISVDEHGEFWHAMVWRYGQGFADPTCKNVDRYYTLPCRMAVELHHWSVRGYGRSLQVDELLADYRAVRPMPTAASQPDIQARAGGARGSLTALLPRLATIDVEELESALRDLNVEAQLEVLANLTDHRQRVMGAHLAPACGFRGACEGRSLDETIAHYEPQIVEALRRSDALCPVDEAYEAQVAVKIANAMEPRAHKRCSSFETGCFTSTRSQVAKPHEHSGQRHAFRSLHG